MKSKTSPTTQLNYLMKVYLMSTSDLVYLTIHLSVRMIISIIIGKLNKFLFQVNFIYR